jgi:hypothetical protein
MGHVCVKIERVDPSTAEQITPSLQFMSFLERAHIQYVLQASLKPVFLVIGWDQDRRCPVLLQGSHVFYFRILSSEKITVGEILSMNRMCVDRDRIEITRCSEESHGPWLDQVIETLPFCHVTLYEPLTDTTDSWMDGYVEEVIACTDDIEEEIHHEDT